jgi:HD-GYP domain-containing protein (c-di-GMP phosphodiesterase class II)
MNTATAFINSLMAAISNCSLYKSDHPSVDSYVKKAFGLLTQFFDKGETLEILIIEDELVINKNPIKNGGLHIAGFIKRMKRKGISRIDFVKGISISELKALVVDLAEQAREVKAYPHIKTGIIDVSLTDRAEEALDEETFNGVASTQVEHLREIYNDVSLFKPINIAGLEEIVINFLITLRREAYILRLLSPVRSYSEYTYTHATNVAILSMFQAESLGFSGKLLHEIGIAALLHDVGKLFVSQEVLEKRGRLEKPEFEEIKKHPIYGANYLSRIEGLTPLATIVALEHHLKYDGSGYPTINRKQHLCSQIVAISDFFDALRSIRPYRRALEAKEILAMMKTRASKDFNPFLLDNFSKILLMTLRRK